MTAIHIHSPERVGNTIRTEITPSRSVSRFFTGDTLTTSYDRSIESVPESILTIPALAQVCPVAWANGVAVSVGQIDKQFYEGLTSVQKTLCELYDFFDGGDIRARNIVETDLTDSRGANGQFTQSVNQSEYQLSNPNSTSALLFTGGVDSTTSFLRHRDESPTLISIRGWTTRAGKSHDKKWDHQRERTQSFAKEYGVECGFIESNMLSCLDSAMLLAHYKRFVDGGWYSSIGHGLGLLGLCAPLAVSRGITDLYIAATHWEGIDLEWGSRPDIDNHVRWANTECHHDCYELTRQERLDILSDFVHTEGRTIELQTCNSRADTNCSACEKCYRTAIGLRLAGLDPNNHGYSFEDQEYVRVRKAFENGEWVLGQDERYMWEDIRNRMRVIEPQSAAERDFFNWLLTTDLSTIVDNSSPPLRHRLVRAGARNAPEPVYRRVYPLWTNARSELQKIIK